MEFILRPTILLIFFSAFFYPTSTGSLPPTELTMPQLLKKAGYSSALIGKWHLGHYNNSLPIHRGFDYFYGLPYSQDEGCPTRYASHEWCDHTWQEIWPGVPLYQNDTIIQQPVDLSTLVPRYNAEAINFITQNQNKPFYLEMAYDEVHVPLFASPNFVNTSRRGSFGDALQEMDASIGLITAYLKKLGIDQNTLIIFTSDNGPWLGQGLDGGSAGLFYEGKGTTWEGGVREPAVARWPGVIPPGSVNFEVTSTMDIFATALEIAGVSLPADRIIDGKSLMPIFKGEKSQHEVYFLYRQHDLQAVRYGPYKAHFITRSGFGEEPPVYHDPPLLFQIEWDPSEKYPLNTTSYPDVLLAINQAVALHKATLIPGPPQLNPQDPFAMPCCHLLTECTCN